MKYLVTDRAPIRHNNKMYTVGDEIELEDAQAEPLLTSGAIAPMDGTAKDLTEQDKGSTVPTDSNSTAIMTSMTREERELELLQMHEDKGWKAIKAVAEKLGIEKPVEGGWDNAIPQILEAEGYKL
jgi:hypothetical protein